jgi:type IV protein arginine methyltransferase
MNASSSRVAQREREVGLHANWARFIFSIESRSTSWLRDSSPANQKTISKNLLFRLVNSSTMAAKNDGTMDTMDNTTEAESIYYDATVVDRMMEACVAGDLAQVQSIVDTYGDLYASQQVDATGCAPLMAAASGGFAHICHYLLQQGAPWNAVDRYGQCAGNVATDREHWDVVNLLVEWGTRAELILGRIEREQKRLLRNSAESVTAAVPATQAAVAATASSTNGKVVPVSHEPSTKPDYLQQRLRYTADGQSLLDADMDAVMMEWERPLMRAHAQALMESSTTSTLIPTAAHQPPHTTIVSAHSKKRVLNVGFGMGIIDSILQDEWQPSHHIIIEAHPDVYQRMIDTGWTKRPNVRVCFGTWQDVVPQLVAEGIVVDAIFYDTVRVYACVCVRV